MLLEIRRLESLTSSCVPSITTNKLAAGLPMNWPSTAMQFVEDRDMTWRFC